MNAGIGRKLIKALLLVLGLFVLGVSILLIEAHLEIRRFARPLPAKAELLDFGRVTPTAATSAGPISVRWVESGRQQSEDGAYSTTGGAVIGWPDGRFFVIDLGMSKPDMRDFGVFIEVVMGGSEMEVFGSLAGQLGAEASRIAGIGFTHLHVDHTQGLYDLCAEWSGNPISVFQLADQFDAQNHTTSGGQASLEELDCVEPSRLEIEGAASPLIPIPGFPGLAAFAAGGHTPGSTVFVIRLREQLIVFAGDITNRHIDLMENTPKGTFYSGFIVPESTKHLATLRPWLASLQNEPGVDVVVAHDPESVAKAGIKSFTESE